MDVDFSDADLERLEVDIDFDAGFPREAVRGFRKAMQAIRAATDERDLYRGGLQMEKLSGKRQHQHSLRLNRQWRLIVELKKKGNATESTILLIEIVDYH